MIDELLGMWEKDSRIDELNIDKTTVESAKLHSKYLSLLSIAKLKLKKKQMDYDALMKDKWLYYTGKMTKEDMDSRGWPYDPFNGGIKPIKGDLDLYYKTDKDLVAMVTQIEYQKVYVDTLVDILENIKWRHNSIKNIIEWKKFAAGM